MTDTTTTGYQSVVRVQPDVISNGTRLVTVTAGEDAALALDRVAALDYVGAVHDAVAMAEYNLAVYGQLIGRGMSKDSALDTLELFMALQARFTTSVAAPLSFGASLGLCAEADDAPWSSVLVMLNGTPIEYWPAEYARRHAAEVLACVTAIELDAMYRTFLVDQFASDDQTAASFVGELAEQRRATSR